MICKNCGTQNPEKAAFCRKCGTRLGINPKPSANPVNPARETTNTRPSARRATEPRSSAPQSVESVQHRTPMRRQLLVTTKKTNTGYLVSNMLGDGLFLGLAVFFYMRGTDLVDSYWYRKDGEAVLTLALALAMCGFLSLLYHVMVSRAYADVFTDRIVGMGMQGIQCKSFDLRWNQITGISISKGFLNIESGGGVFLIINTSAGNYKIITTEVRAKKVTEIYSGILNRKRTVRE